MCVYLSFMTHSYSYRCDQTRSEFRKKLRDFIQKCLKKPHKYLICQIDSFKRYSCWLGMCRINFVMSLNFTQFHFIAFAKL